MILVLLRITPVCLNISYRELIDKTLFDAHEDKTLSCVTNFRSVSLFFILHIYLEVGYISFTIVTSMFHLRCISGTKLYERPSLILFFAYAIIFSASSLNIFRLLQIFYSSFFYFTLSRPENLPDKNRFTHIISKFYYTVEWFKQDVIFLRR